MKSQLPEDVQVQWVGFLAGNELGEFNEDTRLCLFSVMMMMISQ